MALGFAPPQSEGRPHLGAYEGDCRSLAPQTRHPSSLAPTTLRRQPPEVGAVCGKAARTVLCGGRSVMGVPTATVAKPIIDPRDAMGFAALYPSYGETSAGLDPDQFAVRAAV